MMTTTKIPMRMTKTTVGTKLCSSLVSQWLPLKVTGIFVKEEDVVGILMVQVVNTVHQVLQEE